MVLHERRSQWLGLLGFILLARLVLMIFLPLTDTSEPRYAEIARLMVESGDWITPWFEPGVPFWGKPPLVFWASALSFKLFGFSDFAVRFPAWLATLPTLWLIYRYALKHFNQYTARLAVLIYASSLLPFITTGAVLTEAYLTLAITLCLVSFSEMVEKKTSSSVWAFSFFLGLGLGLLSKGPLALVIVAGVLLPWLTWQRLPLALLRRIPWVSGTLLCLTIALPWYLLAEWKTPGFLNYFLLGEHFYRFLDPGWQGDLYGSAHQRMYGSIWFDGLLATMPWGLVALWQLTRWRPSHAHGRDATPPFSAPIAYLLLWMLFTPLLFTFSGNILWTYVLPSLPAFALLLAACLVNNALPAGSPKSLVGASFLTNSSTHQPFAGKPAPTELCTNEMTTNQLVYPSAVGASLLANSNTHQPFAGKPAPTELCTNEMTANQLVYPPSVGASLLANSSTHQPFAGKPAPTESSIGKKLFQYGVLCTLVPLLGLMLGAWFMLHPEQLKTEKPLIETFTAYAQPEQPLYYLEQRPFSARYYSQGQAKLYTGNAPLHLLEQHPTGVYLAMRPELLKRLSNVEGLVLSPVLSKSRKNILLFANANKPMNISFPTDKQ